mmetsp:Transcript_27057/g.30760  ORF Transcript_27057/g.30760 Transcript_27057/m.30760 type:complete len:280 (+) Transcript_27057:27-866(+)
MAFGNRNFICKKLSMKSPPPQPRKNLYGCYFCCCFSKICNSLSFILSLLRFSFILTIRLLSPPTLSSARALCSLMLSSLGLLGAPATRGSAAASGPISASFWVTSLRKILSASSRSCTFTSLRSLRYTLSSWEARCSPMLSSTTLTLPSLWTVRSYFIPLPSIAGVIACDDDCRGTIAEDWEGAITVVVVGAAVYVVVGAGKEACPAVNAKKAASTDEVTTADKVIPMLIVDEDSHSFVLSSAKILVGSVSFFSMVLLLLFVVSNIVVMAAPGLGAPSS